MLTRPLPQGGQPWTPGKSEQKGGKGCVPEEESGSRRKGLSRSVHALNFREEGLFAFANSV
ncbi:hypothetical protein CXT96_00140 [Akkermansia muciniphila]|jgi:hypothetical protein|nr:hypothetical protein CXT92_06915 [Akkermansia muciniphila]PND15413.1 hypothetical protein CXT96_00140 [Akkermansia muciniphila]